jgi:para-nitrobenzyl esterase
VAPATIRRIGRGVLALLAVALLIAGCGRGDGAPASPANRAAPDPALVQTAAGPVRGIVAEDHRFFGGLPYAAPPVGPLRWQPPAPARPWNEERDATRLGPRCLQDASDLEMGRQTDEDCLTLNVWTPPPSQESSPLPVMVWIHGGSFINGSGGIYDSRWLTSRGGVIVVTLNYRLGTMGFLAHPALGPAGAVGNYGLSDQQAALRWVRDNISSFGGDPDRVTVAGESAGGMSVCDHLVAPESQGLFRAAIIQSAPCQAQVGLADAERISIDYAREAGCPDPASVADCLRGLPADRLRDPVRYYRLGDEALSGPVTGTTVLPVDPMAAFARGEAARVPVAIGSNRDEFTLFMALEYLRGRQLAPAGYPKALADAFGPDAASVADHYPLGSYDGSAPLAYSAAVTDGMFACVDDRIAREMGRTGPVYAYEFTDRQAPTPDPFRTLPFPVGASHSLELRYLFDVGGAPALTPAQQELSNQMIDYWSNFVRTGDPAAEGQPAWPEFGHDPAAENRLSLHPDGVSVVTDFDQIHQCPFWASLKG